MLPKKQWSVEKQRKRKKSHKISVLKGSAEDTQTGVTGSITDQAYITTEEVTRNLKVCQNTWQGRTQEDSHGRLRPWRPRRADVFLWVIAPAASPTAKTHLKSTIPCLDFRKYHHNACLTFSKCGPKKSPGASYRQLGIAHHETIYTAEVGSHFNPP